MALLGQMFEKGARGDQGALRIAFAAVIVLLVPVALITTNIRVAISEQAVYDYSVKHYGAANAAGIPEGELLRANAEIRDYLVTDSPGRLSIPVQNNQGETVPLFNARETSHMADVRGLVQAMFKVQVLAVALVLTAAVGLTALWGARVLAAALIYGAFLTGAVLAFTGVAAASGFDSAWSQFHVIAFANDLWKLDPDTDHLIQMFPEDFWFEITAVIGAATFFEAALIALVSGAYLFLTREPRPLDTTEARAALDLSLPRPLPERPELPGRAGHARLAPPDTRHYIR